MRLARRRALRKVHPIDWDEGDPPLARGKVVGVVSPGGGSGATTVAVNVALWLSEGGLTAALVDADPGLGAVAALLGLSEDRSLPYLGHEATLRPVDQDLLDRHLQSYRRLAVLTGRSEPVGPIDGLPAVFGATAPILCQRFPLVIADIGAVTWGTPLALASQCHALVWVVDASSGGADRLDRCLSASVMNPLRAKPSLAVINRAGVGLPGGGEDWLAREYGLSLLGEVPHDLAAVRRGEERLLPPVLGGPLAEPLRGVAGRLAAAVGGRLPSHSELPAAGHRTLAPGSSRA